MSPLHLRSSVRSSVVRRAVTAVAGLALAVVPVSTATAAPLAAAAKPTPIPTTCRAAMTLVRPDTTLQLGVVQGRKGTLYSTNSKLGYLPKTIAYVGTTSNRGISIDRFFAIDPQGRMHRILVTERPVAGAKDGAHTVTLTDTVIASGWGEVRLIVSSGPYVYGITTGGGLRRYAVTPSYGLKGAGTIATSGWGSVTSLAYGGWWNLGSGRSAEDLVALTKSGAVKAYMIPRDKPTQVTSKTLIAKGWTMFSHLSAGECSKGSSRTLAAVKPNGDVYAYLDANGNDQSGKDITWSGQVATGWTGLASD